MTNTVPVSHREPRSRRELAELVLPGILNGELLQADARTAVRIMGGTNWLSHTKILFGYMGAPGPGGITATCRMTLWPDKDGVSTYRIGLEFSPTNPVGYSINEEMVRRFFQGDDDLLRDDILAVRQYWIDLPEHMSIYYYAERTKSVFFSTERGTTEIDLSEEKRKERPNQKPNIMSEATGAEAAP